MISQLGGVSREIGIRGIDLQHLQVVLERFTHLARTFKLKRGREMCHCLGQLRSFGPKLKIRRRLSGDLWQGKVSPRQVLR